VSAFYDRLRATAIRLIADKGQAATIVRTTTSGPAHDPTTTETKHTCKLVETGYSLTNRSDTLVQAGDRVGLISPDLAITLDRLSDKLEIGGARYQFIDLQPLAPGGTVLLYEFVARK